MKIIIIFLISCIFARVSFCQTKVPDYVRKTLKKYNVVDTPGSYHYYNYDEAKQNPMKVIRLDLDQTNLQKVPDEIKAFKNLKILDLSYNRISTLPTWLCKMKNLKKLIISRNEINTLSSEIFNSSIEYLDASSNNINEVEVPIININLKIFKLSSNNLSSVSTSFLHLQSLKTLYLDKNLLTEIPAVIVNIKSLNYLNLYGNPIVSYSENVFEATWIKTLILSRNWMLQSKQIKLKQALPNCRIFFEE